MDYDYDLFVIGGGSGGVRAARVAAQTGAKVGLAEESRMGGTCVIRGCVPKKLMVYASSYPDAVESAKAFGWDVDLKSFDWSRFHGKLRNELDRLEGVYRNLLEGSDVTIHDCRAKLHSKHEVALSDGTTVSARHILIANGGWPFRPDIPCAELGLVSNDLFLLEELPKSLLIIGGGYIACEFACIMHGLGVEVTMYYRNAQILRGFDSELRGLLAESMNQRGIAMHPGTTIVEMALAENRPEGPQPTGSDATMRAPRQEAEVGKHPKSGTSAESGKPIWVKSTNGDEKVFDHVLFATGRRPNTDDMGLEDVGVTLGHRGEIVVDDYSKTAVDNIYAIGDVTGRLELTPVAIREGMAFVETVFKDNPTKPDHDLVPTAIFTRPEIGTIGMTEDEAMETGPIDVYCASFRPMQDAFARVNQRVLMKMLVAKESRKVLGCHIVADHAGEMIQLAGVAIKMGATKEQFDATCAVHPTVAEEIVTMRDPVRSTR